MLTCIKNGIVVNPDGFVRTDLFIEDGVISHIGSMPLSVDRVIDAKGCYVFAGFIDSHTHLDLPLNNGTFTTADDFSTGTRAALVGGTTTVLDFATQERGTTMRQALHLWHEKARGSSCNYGFHMAVSDWTDQHESEIADLIQSGVTSFKMYMVYDNMRVDDGKIYKALKRLSRDNCIVGVHCENYDLIRARTAELYAQGKTSPEFHPVSRPNLVEAEAVSRLMRIAELASSPAWVVHLSTAEGLEESNKARQRGVEVYLETCPQYLTLSSERYLEADAAKYIMSPPLRSRRHVDALLSGLSDIDFIGTDHCSFTMVQKAAFGDDFASIPNGCAGIQDRAAIFYTNAVLTGKTDLCGMARMLSFNAARLFGMYPKRGVIAEGAVADLVVFDPTTQRTISYKTNLHKCDNSPYEGIHVRGTVRDVLLAGEPVVAGGLLIKVGAGKYIPRDRANRYRA